MAQDSHREDLIRSRITICASRFCGGMAGAASHVARCRIWKCTTRNFAATAAKILNSILLRCVRPVMLKYIVVPDVSRTTSTAEWDRLVRLYYCSPTVKEQRTLSDTSTSRHFSGTPQLDFGLIANWEF